MDFALDQLMLATIAGGAGVGCSIVWGFFRGRTTMLLVQLMGTLLFVVHWWLKDADTATVVTAISAVQMAAAIPLGSRPGFRYVYLATLPVIAISMALTWNGVPSFFAALGTAVLSVARYQTNVMRFRVLTLAVTPFWFTHNLMVMSIPAMASDLLGAAVNGAMILRLQNENRHKPVLRPALQGS